MAALPTYFDQVEKFYLTADQKNKLAIGVGMYGYKWTHSNFYWLKEILHKKLRKRQLDRCCYCRRVLVFNKGVLEIEHIVDKGSNKVISYERFTFELRNLALACKDCNNNKGTKSTLSSPLGPADKYPKSPKSFKWVHPYFHKYSDHIIIHSGWVYEANNQSPEGWAVIKKCGLYDLEEKERKNRLVIVDGATSLHNACVAAANWVGEVGLDEICKEFGGHLTKKWKSADPNVVERAIRAAHEGVARALEEIAKP